MKTNTLRQMLRNGEPTLSTHIHSTWPSVIEAIGHAGVYDYVEFVAEYAPYTLYDLDNLARAAELHGLGSMIKVDQSHQGFTAQRAVGSGFESVLFTDAHSADDVRRAISIVRPDTPGDDGQYGVAARRNAYMGHHTSPEYVEIIRDTVVAVMIEKGSAVENIDEVLAVPGIDLIQWGGADYSLSIGLPGQRNHPDVKAAEKHVITTAQEMGIPARAEISSSDQAKYYLDLGVRHFSLGTDITILYQWWKTNGEQLRKVMDGA